MFLYGSTANMPNTAVGDMNLAKFAQNTTVSDMNLAKFTQNTAVSDMNLAKFAQNTVVFGLVFRICRAAWQTSSSYHPPSRAFAPIRRSTG